jgi:hypothetical protein
MGCVIESETAIGQTARLPQVCDVRFQTVWSSELVLKKCDRRKVPARLERVLRGGRWRQDLRAATVEVFQGTLECDLESSCEFIKKALQLFA